MPAPVHMQSLASAFAQILGELYPGHTWDVEVAGFEQEGPRSATAPAPARELPWPDSTTEGGA